MIIKSGDDVLAVLLELANSSMTYISEESDLDELLKHAVSKRPMERGCVASNINVPAEMLDMFIGDESRVVCYALAVNPNTSREALEWIMGMDIAIISTIAKQRLEES